VKADQKGDVSLLSDSGFSMSGSNPECTRAASVVSAPVCETNGHDRLRQGNLEIASRARAVSDKRPAGRAPCAHLELVELLWFATSRACSAAAWSKTPLLALLLARRFLGLFFSLLPTGIRIVFLHSFCRGVGLLAEILLIHHPILVNEKGHHA